MTFIKYISSLRNIPFTKQSHYHRMLEFHAIFKKLVSMQQVPQF